MIASQKIGKSFMGALNYNLKKLRHPDPGSRAELLDTNFTSLDPGQISKEVAWVRSLRPNLSRYVYHSSLNFSKEEDLLNNTRLLAIAHEYLLSSGYSNHQYLIFRHHDADHPHLHLLVNRIAFDGSVVSDSNNFKKSEALLRRLELKYGLAVVEQSSYKATRPSSPIAAGLGGSTAVVPYSPVAIRQYSSIDIEQPGSIAIKPGNGVPERAPTKSELEMVQRTGKASDKMVLQEKLKYLLDGRCQSIFELIHESGQQGIYFLFNQASTGRVTGITYFHNGFKAKGQALGNRFKWAEIIKVLDYEQDRDRQAVSKANRETKLRYGAAETSGTSGEPEHDRGTGKGGRANADGNTAPDADHYQGLPEEAHGVSGHPAADLGEAEGTGSADQDVAGGSPERNQDAAGMDRDDRHHDHHRADAIHIQISNDVDDEKAYGKERKRGRGR